MAGMAGSEPLKGFNPFGLSRKQSMQVLRSYPRVGPGRMRFRSGGPTESTESFLAPVSKGNVSRTTFAGSRNFKRSEMVCTVQGSTAFYCGSWYINPGSSSIFPWLSTMALNYQFYHFRSLRFRFETTSPTSSPGQVIMVPDYNVRDPAPSTEQAACNALGAVAGPCWSNLSLPLSIENMFSFGSRKMIRLGVTGTDSTLCDAGCFNLATVGMTGGGDIGRLWVDYDVDLFTPQVALATLVPSQIQYLSIAADLMTINDSINHPIVWTALNDDELYTVPGADGKLPLPRGIFRLSGTLTLFNDNASQVSYDLSPGLNTLVTGVVPPLTYTQATTCTILAKVDTFGGVLTVPFNFIVRIDANGSYVALAMKRVFPTGAVAGAVNVLRRGTTLTIEPL